MYFPKLMAGPIIKYHQISGQIESRRVGLDDAIYGISRFIWGLSEKVLIADAMAEITDAVFGMPVAKLGSFYAWLGALSFSLQIYFDFSGYSDMAIGLSRLFGFRLMENFNRPYLAVNFTDFWKRWHISLSTWIKDYLYIPLGGNRVPPARHYFNLVLCFFLAGLWHGASWTYIVWGLYHGLFLMLDKMTGEKITKSLPRPAAIVATFFFVLIGWVIFRAQDLSQGLSYLNAMFTGPFYASQPIIITPDLFFFLAIAVAVVFAPLAMPGDRFSLTVFKFSWQTALLSVVVLFLSLAKVSAVTYKAFLYFRF